MDGKIWGGKEGEWGTRARGKGLLTKHQISQWMVRDALFLSSFFLAYHKQWVNLVFFFPSQIDLWPGALTIYPEKPEIPDGNSDGMHCSIPNFPEKMSGLLRWSTFPAFFGFSMRCAYHLSISTWTWQFFCAQHKMADTVDNEGKIKKDFTLPSFVSENVLHIVAFSLCMNIVPLIL